MTHTTINEHILPRGCHTGRVQAPQRAFCHDVAEGVIGFAQVRQVEIFVEKNETFACAWYAHLSEIVFAAVHLDGIEAAANLMRKF